MELKWLEDLLVLLEEKSVTRAAARRHVTQPAYSRRIRQLEDWLGVELVDRSTKPVRIRQSALTLEAGVRDLVSRLYAMRNSVHENLDRITVVAQHTLAISHFPSMIRQVKLKLPEISYRIITANYEECEALFYTEADLLLCYQSDSRQFQFTDRLALKLSLGQERLIPVASRQLAQQLGPLEPGMALPLLMYQTGGFLAELLANHCLPQVIRNYRVESICESAFSASLKEMVLGDMGIAWLAGEIINHEVESGEVVSYESLLGGVDLEIALFYRNESRSGRIGQVIADIQESGS